MTTAHSYNQSTSSDDAKTVLTTSWDGTARIWPIDPLPIARERAPRQLTAEEQGRFELDRSS